VLDLSSDTHRKGVGGVSGGGACRKGACLGNIEFRLEASEMRERHQGAAVRCIECDHSFERDHRLIRAAPQLEKCGRTKDHALVLGVERGAIKRQPQRRLFVALIHALGYTRMCLVQIMCYGTVLRRFALEAIQRGGRREPFLATAAPLVTAAVLPRATRAGPPLRPTMPGPIVTAPPQL